MADRVDEEKLAQIRAWAQAMLTDERAESRAAARGLLIARRRDRAAVGSQPQRVRQRHRNGASPSALARNRPTQRRAERGLRIAPPLPGRRADRGVRRPLRFADSSVLPTRGRSGERVCRNARVPRSVNPGSVVHERQRREAAFRSAPSTRMARAPNGLAPRIGWGEAGRPPRRRHGNGREPSGC